MTGQYETKQLLLTAPLVDDPAWQEGKTHLIVNGRDWFLSKSRDLSVEDLTDARVRWVELRYRSDSSPVLKDRDRRKYGSLKNQTDEAAKP